MEVASDSSETTVETSFANEFDPSESSDSAAPSEADLDETAETTEASEQALDAAPALNELIAELVDLKVKQYETEYKAEAAPLADASYDGNLAHVATESS